MNATNVVLVEQAQAGDPSAFTQLISIYQRMCLSIAFKVVSDAALANDICQDSFIKAWQRVSDLREPGHFGTWLCGIVRNLAVDRVRRRRPTESLFAHSAAPKGQ